MSLFDLAHAIVWPHVDFDVAFFWQRGARRRFDGEVDSAEDGRVGGSVSIGCGAVCTGQRVEGDGDGHFAVTKRVPVKDWITNTWLSEDGYILGILRVSLSSRFGLVLKKVWGKVENN